MTFPQQNRRLSFGNSCYCCATAIVGVTCGLYDKEVVPMDMLIGYMAASGET